MYSQAVCRYLVSLSRCAFQVLFRNRDNYSGKGNAGLRLAVSSWKGDFRFGRKGVDANGGLLRVDAKTRCCECVRGARSQVIKLDRESQDAKAVFSLYSRLITKDVLCYGHMVWWYDSRFASLSWM